MSLATRGNVAWLGMILSGIALGSYVFTAWPDTSPRVIRLPYGEVMPKTPRVVAPARRVEAAAPAAADVQPAVVAAPAAAPVAARVPATQPPPDEAAAPDASAEELGAAPLPGSEQAQPAPADQKQAAAAVPTRQAPAAEPAPEPQPAPEEPPMLEIVIGSAPPSGPE